MDENKKPVYNVIAFALPIVGLLVALFIVYFVKIDDTTHLFLPIFLPIEIMVYAFILGFVFAIISLVKNERRRLFTYITLLINLMPLLWIVYDYII